MLLSVREISERFGVPAWRIHYICRTRGLKPVRWVGNSRLFSQEIVELIGQHVEAIRSGSREDR